MLTDLLYVLAQSEDGNSSIVWQIVIALVVGVLGGAAAVRGLDLLRRRDIEKLAKAKTDAAELEAKSIRKDAEIAAKEMALQEKAKIETQLSEQRQDLHNRERHLDKSEDQIQQRADQLTKQERMVESNQRKLAERLEEVNRRQTELDNVLDVQRQTLHQLSGLKPDEAKNELLSRLDTELANEQGALIQKAQKAIEEKVEAKGREMLITTIQRFAAAHTADATTSTVDIPNDEMKGRIIGREGRNIRAFEKATGVDVIIDDTPGVVIVSAFDPVRREIARISLSKLIADGRIHPSRIEELVAETEAEIEKQLKSFGEEAAQEADVHGLHGKVIQLLGRLRYRTSYSQNVLRHSIEVAFVSGMLAEEMGMDGDLARRAGLLHDIGKAADHDTEGGIPRSAPTCSNGTGKMKLWFTRRWATTTTSVPTCRTPCWWRPPMHAVRPAPVHGVKRSIATSRECRNSKPSRPASRASTRRSPSRQDARSV